MPKTFSLQANKYSVGALKRSFSIAMQIFVANPGKFLHPSAKYKTIKPQYRCTQLKIFPKIEGYCNKGYPVQELQSERWKLFLRH